MFRVPPVGYDQPFPGSEGLLFLDMLDMYNGAFDRYVWKLVGKRELYIPYNSYRLSDGRDKYARLLTANVFTTAEPRYELHSVWKITATEHDGTRQPFGTRNFYIAARSGTIRRVNKTDH